MIRKAIIAVLTLATIGSAVLWATSYRKGSPLHGWSLYSGYPYADVSVRWGTIDVLSSRLVVPRHEVNLRALGWQRIGTAPPMLVHFVWVRLWFLCILFGAYPAYALLSIPFRHSRRRRRKVQGLCLDCGYDLRGLPEPRCPECSTEFDPSTLPSTEIDQP